MRLSIGSLGAHSTGKIINLLTEDVQTVERFVLNGHFFWIGILETVVILSILWHYVGATILWAIFYTCFVMLLQVVCGKVLQLLWYLFHSFSHRIRAI